MREITVNGMKKYACEKCGAEFRSEDYAIFHEAQCTFDREMVMEASRLMAKADMKRGLEEENGNDD